MTTSAVAQILTRSAVPLLSEGLDAGDILECYALVRPASLHNAMVSDATVTIHKVAIGLRYRPLTVNDPADEGKIREITLEYGPQRMGVSLTQESMPTVQHEHSGGAEDDEIDLNSTTSKSFVTWENEGKVYYTTQIQSTGYISAYYMASVTGAVLGKILEKAVEYPMENAYVRGRPRRYQPFVVVDGSSGLPPPGYEGERVPPPSKRKVLLRSSSSTDFMEYMWYTLAELGVNLHPILAPPTYEVQLLATGVEKVKVGPPNWVTRSAATFYQRLYQCIEAKVTGDYSRFSKPPTPPPKTFAPSQAPSQEFSGGDLIDAEDESEAPSNKTESDNHSEFDDNDNDKRRSLRADFPGTPEVMQTNPPIDALKDIENVIHIDDNSTNTHGTTFRPSASAASSNHTDSAKHIHPLPGEEISYTPKVETGADGGGSNVSHAQSSHAETNSRSKPPQHHTSHSFSNATTPTSAITANDTMGNSSTAPVSLFPSSSPSISVPSDAPSMAPTMFKMNKQDTKSEVDEAQEAADQAKQAAAEAKDAAKTDVDTKAADAAQVAAQAAQKAADATSTAAAQAAMEALLSGDGSTIISTLSPCFSDPQFGIAVPGENGTLISQAYLYLDGSSYYRVNLTYPFMQVVPVDHTLPQPRDFASGGEGGDFVDWTLALMLLFLSIFGILMLIQQVFGGYVKLVRPLFNFQIWFFNPRHYEDIKDNIEEERLSQTRQGRGHEYNFGQDAIPVSMGGRRTSHLKPPGLHLVRPRSADNDEDERFRERIPLTGSGEHQEESDDTNEVQEIEMTEARISPSYNRGSSRGSAGSCDSGAGLSSEDNNVGSPNGNGVVGNLELVKNDHRIREKDLPSRFTRDPDLVDMPNLKSSSKVAIPVGVRRNKSFGSAGGNTL